jgi:ADP-ribose pyrophosphatase YjhB (NUDIX family)
VAIFNDEGQILLVRRRDDASWCLPGGRMKPGESLTDCAVRECLEELGHNVELDRLIAVLSNPATQTHRYPDGQTIQFVGVVFRGRLGPRLSDRDGEITDTGWFTGSDLPDEIMAVDLSAIHHALSGAGTPYID